MKAMDANRKDNAADADGDGIADVKQIDSAALASRKLQLLMKATDPNQARGNGLCCINSLRLLSRCRIRLCSWTRPLPPS